MDASGLSCGLRGGLLVLGCDYRSLGEARHGGQQTNELGEQAGVQWDMAVGRWREDLVLLAWPLGATW